MRRRASIHELVATRVWWILPAGLVAVMLSLLLSRERESEPKRDEGFPPEDVEAARLKVLPYRQSGLIFSWQSEAAAVLVTRSGWEALPEDSRRDLGQAMAVAMDVRAVRILDEKAESLLAICTAAGRCRSPSVFDGRVPTPRLPEPGRGERD